MNHLKVFFYLLFMIIPLALRAQSSGFLSYSVSDGLAQSNVVDIVEDNLGNLWLATSAGLSKFDGHKFLNYRQKDGLKDHRITSLAIDKKGRIWIGMVNGLAYFDGFRFVDLPLEILDEDNHLIEAIAVDSKDQIWFIIHGKGLHFIDQEEKIRHVSDIDGTKITNLVENQGNIRVITADNSVLQISDNSFSKVTQFTGIGSEGAKAFYETEDGVLWYGTGTGLYTWHDGEQSLVHQWRVPGSSLDVYSMVSDAQGTLWIGTSKGGFRYDGTTCHPINASNGFIDNIVYEVYVDREDNIWFGTFGGGLYKSLGTTFYSLGRNNGLTNDYVSAIAKDPMKNYWIGTYGGGLYYYEPRDGINTSYKITNLTVEDGLSSNFVFSNLIDRNGVLWIGTDYGLNRYDPTGFKQYVSDDGLPSNVVYATHQGPGGELIFGTSAGLSILENDRFENYYYKNGSKADNRVRMIERSQQGHLWLGTKGGLKIFDGAMIRDGIKDSTYKDMGISAIHEDQDSNLWLGLVDGGLLRYDLDSKQFTHFGQDDGLASDIIYGIIRDKKEDLWVGTNHGLDRLTFSESGALSKIKYYGEHEGFGGIEVNTNTTFMDEDGSIWFGTVQGLYQCFSKNEKINSLEPITSIRSIDLFAKEVNWSEVVDSTYSVFRLPYDLKLDHKENHMTFRFLGNSLKNPNRVRYRYILENFDNDWSPITDKMEAVYTNLPPGRYSFKVKASNNEGVWNKNPTIFEFGIKPPFWRTWWFYLTGLATIFVLGRIYYRKRVKKQLNFLLQTERIKQEEMEKVRKRVATDFHDQVGNQLASITVLVQLIKAQLKNSNNEVQEMLSKLGQFSKSLFIGTKDFVWSIDPKNDYFDEMLVYIRDFGEELFEFSDIRFHVNSRDSFDHKIALPLGWSRHVIYIIKEGLTNSLKHAKCNNVYLNFEVNHQSFVLELKDDGLGLNGNGTGRHHGIGLQNMKTRAKKINGEISISSNNGQGTLIVLKGKIPPNGG